MDGMVELSDFVTGIPRWARDEIIKHAIEIGASPEDYLTEVGIDGILKGSEYDVYDLHPDVVYKYCKRDGKTTRKRNESEFRDEVAFKPNDCSFKLCRTITRKRDLYNNFRNQPKNDS